MRALTAGRAGSAPALTTSSMGAIGAPEPADNLTWDFWSQMVVKLEKAKTLGSKFWDKMQKESLSTAADEALAQLLSDLTTVEEHVLQSNAALRNKKHPDGSAMSKQSAKERCVVRLLITIITTPLGRTRTQRERERQ